MKSSSFLSYSSSSRSSITFFLIITPSVSSIVLTAGSISASLKFSITTFLQKLSIVLILASESRADCFISLLVSCESGSLFTSASSFCAMAEPILSFISLAASLVNVTTKSSSILMGEVSSMILPIILSMSTAVLPEPAAAETKRFPPLCPMTASCSSVHFLSILTLQLSPKLLKKALLIYLFQPIIVISRHF